MNMNISGKGSDSSKEIFLDVLTKEEKEELITKKMEDIRKKNEALRKRHDEIEADRKHAEQMEKKERRKSASPRKEVKEFKSEMDKRYETDEHRQRGNFDRDWGHDDRYSNDASPRHMPDRRHEGNQQNPQTLPHGDLRNKLRREEGRIGSGRFDHSNQESPGRGSGDRRSGNFENKTPDNRRRGGGGDRRSGDFGGNRRSGNFGAVDYRRSGDFSGHDNRQSGDFGGERPSGNFGAVDYRQSGDFSGGDNRHSGDRPTGNFGAVDYRRSGEFSGGDNRHSGNFGTGDRGGQDTADKRPGNRGSPNKRPTGRGKQLTHMSQEKLQAHEYESKRKANAAKYEEEMKSSDGPPPDPGYSFLADPRRQGPLPNKDGSRRHQSNFGGKDFSGVKNKIRQEKDKGRYSGPPRSKMEMSVRMTGRERHEYQEWKQERDKVDQERIQRQKDASGRWTRSWDSEKVDQDEYEDVHSSGHTPAHTPKQVPAPKRPAGRIGSGRFDHGSQTSRQRGDAPSIRESGTPQSGRGRGGRPARRTRFSSSGSEDGRHVEQQNDSLIVKIDNDFASPTDMRPQTKSTKRTQDRRPASKQEKTKDKDNKAKPSEKPSGESKMNEDVKDKQMDDDAQGHLCDDAPIDPDPHDDDEWEDVGEDHEFYDVQETPDNPEITVAPTPEDTATTEDDVSQGKESGLQLQTSVEPLTPTSPDVKTPVGHIKVIDWAAAMDDMSDGSRSSGNSPRDDVESKIENVQDPYEIPKEEVEVHLRASRERELEANLRASHEREVKERLQASCERETPQENLERESETAKDLDVAIKDSAAVEPSGGEDETTATPGDGADQLASDEGSRVEEIAGNQDEVVQPDCAELSDPKEAEGDEMNTVDVKDEALN